MNDQESKKDKIVVLIGNGLGRAFDNEGFATEFILKRLFDLPSQLKPDSIEFFAKIFPRGFPQNEEELGALEELNDALDVMESLPFRVFLCDHKAKIDIFVDNKIKDRFIDSFLDLKTAFLNSIQQSSWQVINNKANNGYANFTKNLNAFIKSTSPTIATINYDILLYQAFLSPPFSEEIFKKNYTDGFSSYIGGERLPLPKFANNLFSRERTPYLHLHGAYFYTLQVATEKNEIEKQAMNYQPHAQKNSLVILTSQKKKVQNVFTSPKDFLRTYSGYFFEKLIEANHIIIFGYGGGDEYLNTNLRYAITRGNARSENIKVTIFCREAEMPDVNLQKKWSNCLGEENMIQVIQPENSNEPLERQKPGCEIRKLSKPEHFKWNYFA